MPSTIDLNDPELCRVYRDAADYVGREVSGRFHHDCALLLGHHLRPESPIEAIFAVWWHAFQEVYRLPQLNLWSQVETDTPERFRIDFVVTLSDTELIKEAAGRGVSVPRIAVELDGHDFHERTRDQVMHRDRRDRVLSAAGWIVLHFSGSEVMRDPLRVVGEVADRAWQEVLDFHRRNRAAREAVDRVTA